MAARIGWRSRSPVSCRRSASAAGVGRRGRRLRADRPGLGAGGQFHQRRIVGPPGARLAAVGDDVPDHRRRDGAPASQPDLRGGAGGAVAVHRDVHAVAAGMFRAAPDFSPGDSWSAMASPASPAKFFREPDAFLGFLPFGTTMGQVLCVPMLIAGVWLIARAR